MKSQLLCGWVVLLLIGCSSSNKEEQRMWKQAAIVHNEMIEQAEILEDQIERINSDVVTIPVDSIAAWKREIMQWEQELVEVPGNEAHHHKEGEHHHHDHQPLTVTPEQMLIIQQDFKDRLQAIEDRIESVLRTSKKSS